MADDKMKSFKIGDTHRSGMSKPPASAKAQEPESFSVGFARIENLLEKEDPTAVSASLSSIYDRLTALHDAATSNKDKLAAGRAMAAVEHAVNLIDYLYQTKSAMEQAVAAE